MKNDFTLADRASTLDLQAYLTRAKRLDPAGMVRVRAFGTVLACYVAPIFAGSLMEQGPTVLGLRTSELAEDAEVDVVVPITAMLDRLAALAANDENWKGKYHVVLPDSVRAPWSGIQPPRSGWELAGEVSEELLTQIAKDGIAEVADSLPESVGGPIAARIRGEIWGRSMEGDSPVPTGAAFVAAGLGFLTENEVVPIYQTQGWIRLSPMNGHILSKVAQSL
ncbi:MAG: hypothetical protein RL166_1021 [Actinomycetota bacterium]